MNYEEYADKYNQEIAEALRIELKREPEAEEIEAALYDNWQAFNSKCEERSYELSADK
jgi:hypothetical protein